MSVLRIALLSLVILSVGAVSPTAINPGFYRVTLAQSANEQVVLYRGNPQRTGSYDGEMLNPISELKWQTAIGSSANAGPVFANGLIYIGCQDGRFYAVDSETGQTRWTFRSDPLTDVFASAAVVEGVVYVGSRQYLFALDARTGAPRWQFNAQQRIITALLVADGAVFFGVEDGNFYAVDLATQQQRWRLNKRPPLLFHPAWQAGLVYIPERAALYAVNSQTGAEVWKVENNNNWYSPTIANGLVYVGNDDGRFYALDAETGATRWTFNAGSFGWSAPAIRNGTVFVGHRNRHFYALNAQTGELRWEATLQDQAVTDPIIVGDTVYCSVGNHDFPPNEGPRRLYAFNAESGELRWAFEGDSRLLTSALIVNKTLYVTSFRGTLYALQ